MPFYAVLAEILQDWYLTVKALAEWLFQWHLKKQHDFQMYKIHKKLQFNFDNKLGGNIKNLGASD